MQRTISISLDTLQEQEQDLLDLQESFCFACNSIVPRVVEYRCWNRVALHKLTYSKVRAISPLGSQMVCNAIFSVCKAYKNRNILKIDEVPTIRFHQNRSVHFDKRTYSIRGNILSLYTLNGRIRVPMRMGSYQKHYFSQGIPKEAELIRRKGRWYFNLVLDMPKPQQTESTGYLGIDLGVKTLAAISSGKLFDGGKIRHKRDQFLAKRRKLQSNGSQSAKQLLKKISGKEARRMKHINHEKSQEIIQEAIRLDVGVIVMEDLKNIRKRIRGGLKLRSQLNRWAFNQFQKMIEYKAEARGIGVTYVNPAYSSQLCSQCDQLGIRQGHTFKCLCGNQQHADLNASRTICRFAQSLDSATCAVNRTQVAAKC